MWSAELQQEVRHEIKTVKKKFKKSMLNDIDCTLRERHGRNTKHVVAKMQRQYNTEWTPKKRVSRADMNRIQILHKKVRLMLASGLQVSETNL